MQRPELVDGDRMVFLGLVGAELAFWWWVSGLATGLLAATIMLAFCRPTP